MKIIIDAYRGGTDTGIKINNQYEKDLLLNASKKLKEELNKNNIETKEIREKDITLSDEDRVKKINEIKTDKDIIIELRYNNGSDIEIIYPLRTSDSLASLISKNLEANSIKVEKYYSQRLPSNPVNDYYYITRNTNPNETLIIYLKDLNNSEKALEIIASTIKSYINMENIYKVEKGDTLYKIANKFNTTVSKIKEYNNLTNDNLSIGVTLKIPDQENNISIEEPNSNIEEYTIMPGDTLYKISKQYSVSVDDIIKINNLKNTILTIGNKLKIPKKEEYINYKIEKGDTLYSIAKKYNTNVSTIKEINNLSNNILTIGNIIKIPKK